MTLSEFKAWLEGFTEVIDGPPSQEQWDRIKEKVASIVDPLISTYPYYIPYPVYPNLILSNLPNFQITNMEGGGAFGH
jgi:hypothetical protein